MHRLMKRGLTIAAAALATLIFAAACDDMGGPKPTAQEEQSEKRDNAYERLLAEHEVADPDYSNDLRNIDFWVETWGTAANSAGKLAYVYLLSSDGQFVGYYVLDGLPTAKCKMATPTYDFEQRDLGEWSGDVMVPAPGLSGTYSSGAGECTTYYGKDASTGAYIEFTVTELTMLTFDRAYPLPEGVEPPALGFTEIGEE